MGSLARLASSPAGTSRGRAEGRHSGAPRAVRSQRCRGDRALVEPVAEAAAEQTAERVLGDRRRRSARGHVGHRSVVAAAAAPAVAVAAVALPDRVRRGVHELAHRAAALAGADTGGAVGRRDPPVMLAHGRLRLRLLGQRRVRRIRMFQDNALGHAIFLPTSTLAGLGPGPRGPCYQVTPDAITLHGGASRILRYLQYRLVKS